MSLIERLLNWADSLGFSGIPWWGDLLVGMLIFLAVLWKYQEAVKTQDVQLTRIDGLVGELPPDMHPSEAEKALEIAERLADRKYIYRRVERITFPGFRTANRHVSIDVAEMLHSPCIPIGMSLKDTNEQMQTGLRNFSVVDATGRALPLLGRKDNSRWTYYAIVAWIERLVNEETEERIGGEKESANSKEERICLSDDEKNSLWQIVSEVEKTALESYFSLIFHVTKNWYPPSGDETHVPGGKTTENQALETESYGEYQHVALALRRSSTLVIVLSRLATSWVMLVEAPHDGPNCRTVIKYSFDESLMPEISALPWEKSFWTGLGWGQALVILRSVTSLPSMSVHIEFRSPVGMDIQAALLESIDEAAPYPSAEIAERGDPGVPAVSAHTVSVAHEEVVFGSPERSQLGQRGSHQIAWDSEADRYGGLSHVYLPAVDATHKLRAVVYMRLQPTPQIRFSVVGLILLVVFLWFGVSDPQRVTKLDASVILTVPSALAGFMLVRQHKFVSLASRSFRLLMSSTIGISFAALGLIVVAGGKHYVAVSLGFRVLRWPATIFAIVLLHLLVPDTTSGRNN